MHTLHNQMGTTRTLSKKTSSLPALQLDFQHAQRKSIWPNRLLLLSGILITLLLSYQFVVTQNAIAPLESKRTLIEHTVHHSTRQVHLTPEQMQTLHAEIKDAKSVMTQLNLPWGPLLQDIGTAQQNQVALLSIVPDVPKRIIKISGEAKDLNTILGYVRALQKARSLGSVYLKNHHIVTSSTQRPVRFTVLATWVVK